MRLGPVAMLFGAGFGFVLGWARLSDPDVLHRMLMLREFDVFLLMGAAIATASIGVRVLRAARFRSVLDGTPVAWKTLSPNWNHVLGSMAFGLGWSVSNACPGPIAVQLGRGEWSAVFTAVGLMGGIAVRDAMTLRGLAAKVPPAAAPPPIGL
jgi:hypothetical protein